MNEKFVTKSVDENGDGLDVYRVVQVGIGGTSGMVTDDSETFRLDNLESGVVGGTCVAPDRGGISKNGSKVNLFECVSAESRARTYCLDPRGKYLKIESSNIKPKYEKIAVIKQSLMVFFHVWAVFRPLG